MKAPSLRALVLPALAVGFFACDSGDKPEARAEAQPSARAAKEAPARIASQSVLADEVLWDLGEDVRGRVVAVSYMADDRRYSIARWSDEVARIGGGAERILATEPDLAIVADFTAQETKAMLRDAGVKTVELSGWDGFEDYRRHVVTIAEAVGASEAGREVVRRFDARLAALESSKPTSPAEVVSFDDGLVPGSNTTFHAACLAAGVDNLAAKRGVEGHRRVDLETLLEWDPTWVVISCPRAEGCEAIEEAFAARPGIAATRAAREGHVVAIDSAVLAASGADMATLAEILQSRIGSEP